MREVVGRNICREKLGAAGLLDGRTHSLHHLRDALVHLAEDLVALRLVILDEVTSGFRPNNHLLYKLIKMETSVVNNCLFVVVPMLMPLFRRRPVDGLLRLLPPA